MGIDDQADRQVDAIATLLAASLRAKFGDEVVAHVYRWPVRVDLLNGSSLAVYRATDQQDPTQVDESQETTTVAVVYYAPVTPLDRANLRWPLLRAVWRHAMKVLRLGYDQALGDTNVLQAVDIAVPSGLTARATYQLAQGVDSVVPMLSGLVTIKVGEEFDWDDDYDDLDRIYTTATETTTDQPAFEAIQDDDA